MNKTDTGSIWWKEGLIGGGAGLAYGLTTVLVGHPIDTIKNKMQAQQGFEARNSIKTVIATMRQQGIYGLYRGSFPQFCGSLIFRSAQFWAYTSVYHYMNGPRGQYELPGGIKCRVIAGGFASGVARALFETPIDYWKIRRQIVKEWKFANMFTGFRVTMLRGSLLMTTFFVYLDAARRYAGEETFENPFGTFLITGVCTTAAWWTVWPLEYMKSQIQGGYGNENMTLVQRIQGVYYDRGGIVSLYRGIGPGTVRSFLANGISMIVFLAVKKKLNNLFA